MNITDDNYGEIFDFYEDRGYGYRIGIGANPALIVIDFSCGFTRGSNDFPGGNFSEAIAATNQLLHVVRGRFPVFFTTIAYDDPEEQGGWWAKKVPWLLCLEKLADAVKIDPVLGWHPDDTLIENPSMNDWDFQERYVDRLLDCSTIGVGAIGLEAIGRKNQKGKLRTLKFLLDVNHPNF